ncbi:MAG: hypothetical protein HPY57_14755 [Ignavibacteria bacterium]|nr:hypothetical protein [Ignavibacteria bacterium]
MFKEIISFIKNINKDYKDITSKVPKKEKAKCFKRIIKNLFIMIWSGISAPFIYPVWYLFRKPITKKIYKGTSWQEIEKLMADCETELAKQKLKANGKFLYWLWTYGDAVDPLERGGLPTDFRNGKNTFCNRFMYSAIRNPRFNINYMELRTGRITDVVVVIDERNFHYMHNSYGIGDSPDGKYFKWMKDNNEKWYFIYEDNNKKHIFYFGYTGLLMHDIGNKGGRFETSYRKTDGSYYC